MKDIHYAYIFGFLAGMVFTSFIWILTYNAYGC